MPERSCLHLNVEAVLAIHSEVLAAHGGAPGIRERSLLESAVAAPKATYGGEPLIEDPIEIAAAYLFYLCRNHPFIDGNKRTALAACLVFLSLNGLLPDADMPGRDIDRWEAWVLAVASSELDREATAEGLKLLLARQKTTE